MNRVRGDSRTCVHESIEVGGILPKFVGPSDVRALKNRVNSFVLSMDASVADCKTLPDGVRNGWEEFSKAWHAYFTESDSWLHAAAEMDQGEAYEQDVRRWYTTISNYKCAASAPEITPTDPGLDDVTASKWQGTIKTVAIAGAVVAAILGVRAVMK